MRAVRDHSYITSWPKEGGKGVSRPNAYCCLRGGGDRVMLTSSCHFVEKGFFGINCFAKNILAKKNSALRAFLPSEFNYMYCVCTDKLLEVWTWNQLQGIPGYRGSLDNTVSISLVPGLKRVFFYRKLNGFLHLTQFLHLLPHEAQIKQPMFTTFDTLMNFVSITLTA